MRGRLGLAEPMTEENRRNEDKGDKEKKDLEDV